MSDPADTVARTIWGEARGTGAAGMSHVGSVIANRAAHPRWWGHDLESVCRAPLQFSCWDVGDPNRPKLEAVTDADAEFRFALTIAESIVAGTLVDETGGADSYYAVGAEVPYWARANAKTISDGWHNFYRLELPPPGPIPVIQISTAPPLLVPPKEPTPVPTIPVPAAAPTTINERTTQATAGSAVGGALAVSTIMIWLLSLKGVEVPNDVAVAITSLLSIIGHYFVVVIFTPKR